MTLFFKIQLLGDFGSRGEVQKSGGREKKEIRKAESLRRASRTDDNER